MKYFKFAVPLQYPKNNLFTLKKLILIENRGACESTSFLFIKNLRIGNEELKLIICQNAKKKVILRKISKKL